MGTIFKPSFFIDFFFKPTVATNVISFRRCTRRFSCYPVVVIIILKSYKQFFSIWAGCY